MGYSSWSVIAGEQPTTAKWNILGTNDSSFNDGSGLAFSTNNVVPANALATNAITLGYTQITSNFTTASTTAVQVTGLTANVTIPAGGRKILILAYCGALSTNSASQTSGLTIWDGTVGSGTQLQQFNSFETAANGSHGVMLPAVVTPAAGAKTYNVGMSVTGGTGTFTAAATLPGFILVEAI